MAHIESIHYCLDRADSAPRNGIRRHDQDKSFVRTIPFYNMRTVMRVFSKSASERRLGRVVKTEGRLEEPCGSLSVAQPTEQDFIPEWI
mmetsp:Transcript_24508/g.61194  ORF Transcript_24508/g.61194 Transcript_24508/m.61194 type:complete len:89 (-) Transcript_24508:118-384(-)